MRTLATLFTLGAARRPADADHGPALALGYPDRGQSWTRPWGRIETTTVATRARKATLSVKTSQRHIAILTTDTLTPEILHSSDWILARRHRRGQIGGAFLAAFTVVLLVGSLLLATLLPATLLAALVLLILATAAGFAAIVIHRDLAAQADATMREAGHDWWEIELGDDDALVHLIEQLDALATDWQRGLVDTPAWTTARRLTQDVVIAARAGALIDNANYELRTARAHIDMTREAIADGPADTQHTADTI